METHAEEASKAVNSALKKLQHALKQKEPDYAILETGLEKLRVRSGNLALLHLTTGLPVDQSAEQIESKLWKAHCDVNSRFKATLKVFREGDGRKKHVERRKAEKLYVDYIKASQRFYRAYIGRLVANFTDIPKVLDIAQKLGQVGLTAEIPRPADDTLRRILETSCKLCVIRLGDLSRWRETELQLKERNWGPAKGYYQLALSMDPADGTCYNQLAVIARKDEDHLGAVYYLYRATAVGKPFPTATDNIKNEFEKLIGLRTEESYGLTDNSGDDVESALEKRFLAFHAHCYARPYDFVAFQQKANDILGMIALCFQDTTQEAFDRFVQKACLVNIAAGALAQRGMTTNVLLKKLDADQLAREIERSCQSYFLFQRFNLLTFQALLRVLARELGDAPNAGDDLTDLSRLSPTVRNVLPHLRQYSSWFLSNMRALVETKFKSSRLVLEQVCKTYAQTLNLLRSHIDVFAQSQVTYLLDEDEKTLSFTPFSAKVVEWRYHQADKSLKQARFDDGNGKSMPELLAETHLRSTDLIVDALRLVKQMDDLNLTFVPLTIDNGQFAEQKIPEEVIPEAPPSPPKQVWKKRTHGTTPSMSDVPPSPSRPLSSNAAASVAVTPAPDVAVVAVKSVKDRSKKSKSNGTQVESAKEPSQVVHTATQEPSVVLNSSSIAIGTPAEASNANLTAMDLVRRMQQRSTGSSPVSQKSPDSAKKHVQPSLPSVFNTPFAPTASEQAQLSPRLDSARGESPSFTTPVNSSAAFQENIAQQQRDIELRSSPQPPFQPTPSWFVQTPTGMETFARAYDSPQDPIASPFTSPHGINGRSPGIRTVQHAPFGVIGQARPVSRGAPTG